MIEISTYRQNTKKHLTAVSVLFILFILIISCNSSDTARVASGKKNQELKEDMIKSKNQRKILVEELRRINAIIVSKDKEKIADIFPFPLSDTAVEIYIEDSTFNAQFERNGNKITRAMFLNFFTPVSENLQIDQINQLFRKLDINNLLQKDTLRHETIIKTEPCYHYYGIDIEKELVTLTAGTNSNKGYKSKSVSEDEIPENSSEFCEHVVWWVFRFDGKRLHFVKQHGAG